MLIYINHVESHKITGNTKHKHVDLIVFKFFLIFVRIEFYIVSDCRSCSSLTIGGATTIVATLLSNFDLYLTASYGICIIELMIDDHVCGISSSNIKHFCCIKSKKHRKAVYY